MSAMNIALVTAGGSGQRMGKEVPKQFINVFDKPIVIYTLEAFQKHPDVDAIMVVCIEGWHDILRAYAKQYGISKLRWVISGGENGQDSIRNGVLELEKHCHAEDIVIVHDGIRPMLSSEIISDSIAKCIIHGSAVTVIPCNEAMLLSSDGSEASMSVDRSVLRRTQTPQTFRLGELAWAQREALERGITNSVACCTLMVELGRSVYFSVGSEKNIKITTPEDIDIFKALLKMQETR